VIRENIGRNYVEVRGIRRYNVIGTVNMRGSVVKCT
jgi:hypothetical protein